jgi:hypothetical protein
MKIGVIVKADISNAAYRAITPMLALGECGHEVVLAKLAAGGKFALRDLLPAMSCTSTAAATSRAS